MHENDRRTGTFVHVMQLMIIGRVEKTTFKRVHLVRYPIWADVPGRLVHQYLLIHDFNDILRADGCASATSGFSLPPQGRTERSNTQQWQVLHTMVCQSE